MSSFEDDRGIITDIYEGPLDAVTRIFTWAGSIRGNHYHRQTLQITHILEGELLIRTPDGERVMGHGQSWVDEPGVPHAWKALTDCAVIVMTKGPRSGKNYESDTVRLEEPLIA